jgi:hypothetical protein
LKSEIASSDNGPFPKLHSLLCLTQRNFRFFLALRLPRSSEKGVLSAQRIERREIGTPGEFEALTDDELQRALVERANRSTDNCNPMRSALRCPRWRAPTHRTSSLICRCISLFPSLFRLQRWTELNHSSAGGRRGSGGSRHAWGDARPDRALGVPYGLWPALQMNCR